jgi:hypothetical protein
MVLGAALVLLPLVPFFRAALGRGVFYVHDVQHYFYPYHALPAALLARGELPLWNAYAFSGMPLLGDGQTALFYPPNWLFFVLPGAWALNYDIVEPARSAAEVPEVRVTLFGANEIVLATRTAERRLLVLSEVYFPGWRASIDEAETEIYRTNYVFRGFVVPPGGHTVVFRYRPGSVVLGAGISLAAMAVSGFLLWPSRREGRGGSSG